MKINKLIYSSLSIGVILFILTIFYYFFTKEKSDIQSISVLCWCNSFSSEMISLFEEKNNIRVNLKYYTTNEELMSKLSLSNEEIDIICPSDYIVVQLENKKLIKEIDISRISYFKEIIPDLFSPVLINKKYYGIPIEWGVYGLVINNKVKEKITSNYLLYKAFFEGTYNGLSLRLAMTNDLPNIVNIVYFYYKHFFKKNKILDKKNLLTIMHEILKKQKKYVIAYTDTALENLFLSDIVDIAIMQSDRFIKMKQEYPDLNVNFILSPYHILQVNEYVAIPSNSKKDDLCYQFINFLLEKEVLIKNINEYGIMPVLTDLFDTLDDNAKNIFAELKKYKDTVFFTKEILNQKDMAALWMKLKS